MSRRAGGKRKQGRRRNIKRYVRLALFLASLVPLTAAARHFMGWLSGGDAFLLSSVEVSGTVNVSPEQVEPLARLEMGIPLLSIDPAILGREITSHP